MPINYRMENQNIQSYNWIFNRNKNKRTTAMCNKVVELHKHMLKQMQNIIY